LKDCTLGETLPISAGCVTKRTLETNKALSLSDLGMEVRADAQHNAVTVIAPAPETKVDG